MSAQSPKELVSGFFDNTSNTYDKIAKYATFGKDNYWKEKILNKINPAKSILDLACGTGILTRKISAKFPNSKIIGIDITKSYLKIAKQNSSRFSNIFYLHQDAEKLELEEKFDCICSSYIPKYCNPEILTSKCVLHLNPNGRIILHDFTYPKNPLIRFLWNSYFVLLRLLGFFIPTWKEAFIKLPDLIKNSNWLESYTKNLQNSGFQVNIEYMTLNTSAILTAQKQ